MGEAQVKVVRQEKMSVLEEKQRGQRGVEGMMHRLRRIYRSIKHVYPTIM